MKKVFAVGVISLLMMGTASQAMADFAYGDLMMVIYDKTAGWEVGFSLGNIDTLLNTTTAQTKTINIGSHNWSFNPTTSGVGVFADATTKSGGFTNTAGYYAITSNELEKAALGDNTAGWRTAVTNVTNGYSADIDKAVQTTNSRSYTKAMNLTDSSGKYGGIRTKFTDEAEYPSATDSIATMYLWSFKQDPTTQLMYMGNNGQSAATITLTNAGLVTFTATPAVPVPGAALLFGSALLGLAGIRRRQNS